MICVDASVAIKWLFDEEYTWEALALADEAKAADEAMLGPPHLRAEVSNIVYGRMRWQGVALSDAQLRLGRFARFPVFTQEPEGLYLRAIEFAQRYGLASGYDAVYLALAWLMGAELWTDDRRLLRALRGRVTYVHWIGDWG
jgi:predicted nucleic acid-binding protein